MQLKSAENVNQGLDNLDQEDDEGSTEYKVQLIQKTEKRKNKLAT